MRIALLSAPSNLGLRPPAPTSVPGCAKAPEALREAGLHRRLAGLGAQERGVVLPGRYADDATPGSLRNQAAIIERGRADRTARRPRSACGRRPGDRLRPGPRPGRQPR